MSLRSAAPGWAGLVEAARTLFLRQGYPGATMEEIAALAGLTKRAVHNNYADKEALFTQFVVDVIADADEFARGLGSRGTRRSTPRASRLALRAGQRDTLVPGTGPVRPGPHPRTGASAMSSPRTGLLAGIATILALVTSVHSRAALAQPQGDIGIKAGDTVTVGTGQGWVMAIVLGAQGHLFNVRIINGPEVPKRYPTELRRRGKPTGYDRTNGIYEVGDRVKVDYQGQWVDSRVITGIWMEYQVELPGNMTGWAKPEQLRFMSEAPPKDVAKAGKPPRPGLVSCAGKIEGRYAAAGAMPVQMTFRSGKVTLSMMGDNQTGECWTGDGKLFITLPGEEGAMEIDINDDGSLQAPFGELKKKGQ